MILPKGHVVFTVFFDVVNCSPAAFHGFRCLPLHHVQHAEVAHFDDSRRTVSENDSFDDEILA